MKASVTTTNAQERIRVCAGTELAEGAYLKTTLTYDGEAVSVVVFRYRGRCLAYKNLCVHMPRALDCEQDMIFDASGRYLRCSMHGIVYDPISGESRSDICRGQRLTAIEVIEDDDTVWIEDRHVRPLPAATGMARA